jgi:hypothetical protein
MSMKNDIVKLLKSDYGKIMGNSMGNNVGTQWVYVQSFNILNAANPLQYFDKLDHAPFLHPSPLHRRRVKERV